MLWYDENMEHRQLLNFLALCEEKSFSRAADRRCITQQGLSKSIRELEKEIGMDLVDRSHQGAMLTEYGKVLESAARAYANQHDYILETLTTMREKSEFRLGIGLTEGAPANRFFLPIIRYRAI
jgi:DNA-binding transcriptional LysR family regulator